MRTGQDSRGRARVWFEFDEIEQLAATTLRASGHYPHPELRRVEIDDLLENHLGATVDYAGELDRTVLGYTEFRTPPHVVISRALTDLATADGATLGLRGRWRATLAHEAAHIILHAPLFTGASSRWDAVRCQRDTIDDPHDGYEWIEVQANMGMAALLMPRAPFLLEARRLLELDGPAFPPLAPGSSRAESLVSSLADTFEASHQSTSLRLITFGFITAER